MDETAAALGAAVHEDKGSAGAACRDGLFADDERH
jgi:hypothetical protein